jgi:thiamine-phosphate pyrophosphorylase
MLMAANLARRPFSLNALLRSAACLNPDMPLVLMTDDRKADWQAAARRLPRGGLVVVRARTAQARLALAQKLDGIAPLLIADDPLLAARIGAAGLHLPERRMGEAMHWRGAHPDWIITASAHSLRALMQARALDAVFLSPVFATGSHEDARPLSPVRAALIAAHAPVPVYALGGITPRNAARLGPAFSGIAAISALL